MQHDTLHKLTSNIVEYASVNEEKYNLAIDMLEFLQYKNIMTINDGEQSSTLSISLSQWVCNELKKLEQKDVEKKAEVR